MGATLLTITKIALTGIDLAPVAIDETNGNYFVNTGRCLVYVENAAVGAFDILINSQALCSFGVDHDITVNVGISEKKFIGPFPKSRFDDADGYVQITYGAGAQGDLTIQILELP